MSSEILGGAEDVLKGNLGGAWDIKHGYAGAYTDLGIARKFGVAAAAYSLRDIGAMNGPVVRVRRESDNAEADFSADAVPFIADWVNRQTVRPLDIRALDASTGERTGALQTPAAAYSLRALSTENRVADIDMVAPDDIDVENAGTSECNGTYVRNGESQDLPAYTLFDSGGAALFSLVGVVNDTVFLVRGDPATFTDEMYEGTMTGASGTEFPATLPDAGVGAAGTPELTINQRKKYVVQVRRSSTSSSIASTFQQFTADEVTDGTLTTFCGTGDGFVVNWYDQSGNAKHASQSNHAEQPKIVSSGSLVSNGIDFASGSSATLDMPTDLISSINSASAFVVAKSDTTSGSRIGLALSRNSPDFRFYVPFLSSSNFNFGYQDSATKISLGSADTNKHLFTAIAGSSNAEAFLDGTSKGTVSSADGKSALSSGGIGTINDGSHWNGQIEEILVYANDQTDNRGAYEGNMADHYNISGVPTEDNTVNGFVETWYDQSGNSRPLIQTSATEQPLIVENGVFLNGVKANKATSNSTMQNLQVSTDGTNANFGTDDWASGASSKLGLIYVGTVPPTNIASPNSTSIIWGGGRGVSGYQEGGLSFQVIKGGTDSWRLTNERNGLSPTLMTNSTNLNTDNDIVLYGIADNRDFTINVNGSGDTETESADLDVRENAPLSLFGSYAANGSRYYQRSTGGVCKECYLYAGTSITSIPTIATKINEHYSIY